MTRKKGNLATGVILALMVISAPLFIAAKESIPANTSIRLSEHCPPGFEKTAAALCELRSLYQFYDSLQDKGVGGLKSGLPSHRDGFSPQQIDLGRYLFFDPVLSGDGSLSCASCHHPDLGFSDGLDRSIGVLGEKIARSAPTIWNTAFLNSFFWDARAKSLEAQMLGPLYAADEMGNTRENLLITLNNIPAYRQLFRQAYPPAVDPQNPAASVDDRITLQQIYTAIAAFESSLVSLNSRYDHYAHGDHNALSQQEIEGLNIFRSFVARCAECHTPPLFTNQQVAVLGTPEPEGLALDIGAEKTFNNARLKGGFKVPTLRNIAKTAPYMHSGRFKNLRDTVAFYTKGRGHAVPDGVEMHLHWHIWEPNLSDEELDRLVDFLHTLSDETFKPVVPQQVPSGLDPIKHDPIKHKSDVLLMSRQASLAGEN